MDNQNNNNKKDDDDKQGNILRNVSFMVVCQGCHHLVNSDYVYTYKLRGKKYQYYTLCDTCAKDTSHIQ